MRACVCVCVCLSDWRSVFKGSVLQFFPTRHSPGNPISAQSQLQPLKLKMIIIFYSCQTSHTALGNLQARLPLDVLSVEFCSIVNFVVLFFSLCTNLQIYTDICAILCFLH